MTIKGLEYPVFKKLIRIMNCFSLSTKFIKVISYHCHVHSYGIHHCLFSLMTIDDDHDAAMLDLLVEEALLTRVFSAL